MGNGKYRASFNAIYSHRERRGGRDGKEETCQSIERDIFCRARWATTRRRGFLRQGEFSISHARVPFYALSRRSSSEITLTGFFLNLTRAFVTRYNVITFWIPITASDWQAIVDHALCKLYDYSNGLHHNGSAARDRLFSFEAPDIETAGIAFFLGPCPWRTYIYLRTQRGAAHDGDITLLRLAIHSY